MRMLQFVEGRDAPLFHGTPIIQFLQIMNDDALLGSNPSDIIGFQQSSIRFSRSYTVALNFSTQGLYEDDHSGAVIEIDQRLLAQRYKIRPFADIEVGATRAFQYSEFEEVVLTNEIKPLSTVMTRFYINENNLKLFSTSQYIHNYKNIGWSDDKFKMMVSYLLEHPKRRPIK